ncbi:MAG TPA: peroxiredoxin-like family protein [bacterium]|nr:peroxiredoxin-like family protein [bacterium]
MSRTRAAIAVFLFLTATFAWAHDGKPADKLVTDQPVAGAETEPVEAPVPVLGLEVGTAAPSFELLDVDGKPHTLADLLKEGWVVLVTYRGGWCPYCNEHLQASKGLAQPLREAGARLVAVSVDLPAEEAKTYTKHGLDFLVLSDPYLELINAYNIANVIDAETVKLYEGYGIDLEAYSGQRHHTIAHPAVIIIDPDGIIRFFHVNADYKVRMTPDEIQEALDSAMLPMQDGSGAPVF